MRARSILLALLLAVAGAAPLRPTAAHSLPVGDALDGYPILGMRDADGALITNADLDACHGRHENVTVDGRSYDYAYRLTQAYPYTLGCFTGVVDPSTIRALRRAMGPVRGRP